MLTTNHRERLDPALIRNGRVDVHVEFADATTEQMRGLFSQFYKAAPATLAADFAAALEAKLGKRTVSMAALQAFFIAMRKSSAEEAIGSVGRIISEMHERDASKAASDAAAAPSTASNDTPEEEGDEEGDEDGKGGAEGKQVAEKVKKAAKVKAVDGETHVHVHIHKP